MIPAISSVAIVGGGPGGLFLASLLRRGRPDVAVTVLEQNRRADAFGFGVVFSDATLDNIDEADPVLRDGLRDHGVHWDRIEVWSKGERHGFGGNGMAAIHRKTLLRELQRSAEEVGTRLCFGVRAPDLAELRTRYDVVVGADGTNSTTRGRLAEHVDLGHEVDVASAKFIWFGTTHRFDGLTFVHRVSEHGNFAVHGYPIGDQLSTFIVETDANTWRRAGLDAFDSGLPAGVSDRASQRYLEEVFAEDIRGARLVANNSRWSSFRTRRTHRWTSENVALLGDAVHTAHFSVGSGTKMAMEDSVVLARELLAVAAGAKALDAAFAAYEQERKRSVGRIQSAAGPSLSWWENFGDYQRHLDPVTFAFHFFSRSIGIDRIARRDPAFAALARETWFRRHGAPALETGLDLGGTTFARRTLSLRTDGVLTDSTGAEAAIPVVIADDEVPVGPLPASGAVVVSGPAGLRRTLVAEEARLRRGLTTVVAGDDLADPSAAETAILSGRADAVATTSEGER